MTWFAAHRDVVMDWFLVLSAVVIIAVTSWRITRGGEQR